MNPTKIDKYKAALPTVLFFVLATPAAAFTLSGTTPGKWGDPTFGTGAHVTYSFMGSGFGLLGGEKSVALDEFMPRGYRSEIASAFDAWADVSGLTFSEVTDPNVDWNDPGAYASDIRITGHDLDSNTLAHAFYPPNNGGPIAGDIHFGCNRKWKKGFFGRGFNIFQVAAHEIGHAIGLAHVDRRDKRALMNPVYSEASPGLMPDDIAGAQAIYGKPVTPVTPVPLPAALFLLGGTLGVFGSFAGWKSKRKQQKV